MIFITDNLGLLANSELTVAKNKKKSFMKSDIVTEIKIRKIVTLVEIHESPIYVVVD